MCKKSGLASEALTRVQEQLEQNSQFLWIPYNICINLVYSSFFYLENWRRCEPKCKKMDRDKMNRLSIFICEDSISFKPKNTFLTLDSQRPIIYQINGNFMRILMDLSDLIFYLCKRGITGFTGTTVYTNPITPWWITKKWTHIDQIISPNQSSYLQSAKFRQILT